MLGFLLCVFCVFFSFLSACVCFGRSGWVVRQCGCVVLKRLVVFWRESASPPLGPERVSGFKPPRLPPSPNEANRLNYSVSRLLPLSPQKDTNRLPQPAVHTHSLLSSSPLLSSPSLIRSLVLSLLLFVLAAWPIWAGTKGGTARPVGRGAMPAHALFSAGLVSQRTSVSFLSRQPPLNPTWKRTLLSSFFFLPAAPFFLFSFHQLFFAIAARSFPSAPRGFALATPAL